MSSLHVISAAHCTVRETPDSMEVILGKHWADARGTRASNEGSQRFHSICHGIMGRRFPDGGLLRYRK